MAAKRKDNRLWILVAMLAGVAVIVTGAVVFQQWWNQRPGTNPEEVALTAKVAGSETEVLPYQVCKPGEACSERKPALVKIPAGEKMLLDIHPEVADHDWSLLRIYDDPAANSEDYFTANQESSIEIEPTKQVGGDKKETARLVVVEVQSLLIGRDSNNEETPVQVVWSIEVGH
ncbi:DUF2771 domain-containing protein [Corynebacterium ulceribovis]|uniref:DUF2771 domain-containing protein n=1 Tax=Corynebacterium ulceribovis TaxID=487732 RepID=UPI00037396C1|nr:DUF2771 domain-containing protein [Corynebacterium ulceribovis]